MKKIKFRTNFLRKFPDPLKKKSSEEFLNVEHYSFLTKAKEMPAEVPTDPNPRQQNTDKSIYKKVQESLLREYDLTFHLKNKGITIIAHSVEVSEDKEEVEVFFNEGDGIVDGGHTYKIICENKLDCPDEQSVKIEVITGLPGFMISPIAEGLNTAVQVQEISLANLREEFDWIKSTIKDEAYADKIAYVENQDGEFSIRDIIALLTLFNIKDYPNDIKHIKHPKIAYTSKSDCLEQYLKNKQEFLKMKPILKDVLKLYDHIHVKARDLYNAEYDGRAAGLAFYQNRKRGKYKLVFTNQETQHILFDGALYPILGAFRFLVEEKNGVYSWKVGSFDDVLKFFDIVAGKMIYITKNTSDGENKNPNAIGKNDNHWDNLYNTVALAYLTQKR